MPTATVTIRLHGGLIAHTGSARSGERIILTVPAGTSVLDLCKLLHIRESHVHLVFVGTKRVPKDYQVADGDELNFFPPMAGG